ECGTGDWTEERLGRRQGMRSGRCVVRVEVRVPVEGSMSQDLQHSVADHNQNPIFTTEARRKIEGKQSQKQKQNQNPRTAENTENCYKLLGRMKTGENFRETRGFQKVSNTEEHRNE